jgi:ubiquinone/menaquinone biosynthesis C-methylase UbiE
MEQSAEHKGIIYDEVVAKVWNKTGMIKSYAATYKVFHELKINGFAPRTMLDFGCGTGPGLWAANAVFKDSLMEYTGVDQSLDQIRMARFVVTGGHPGDNKMQFSNGNKLNDQFCTECRKLIGKTFKSRF